MEKRIFLAITLSLLVVLGWSAMVNKAHLIDNKMVTTETLTSPNQIQPLVVPSTISQTLPVHKPELSLFRFSHNDFELVFSETEATIKEVIFKHYLDSKFNLQSGFLLDDSSLRFHKDSSFGQNVDFVHEDNNKKITKHFIFSNSLYNIELEIRVENLSPNELKLDLPIIIGIVDLNSATAQGRFQEIVFITDEKTLHLNGNKDFVLNKVNVLGIRDKYFCAIVEPQDDKFGAFIKRLDNKTSKAGFMISNLKLSPGQSQEYRFRIYLGPQDLKMVNRANPAWSSIINYGTFDIIAQILFQALELIHGVVKNWGWAIVVLSLLIYIILFPLSLKQMHSMKRMQALQPEMEELKKVYKSDATRLNKEIMELYRKNKINPLGGCLPLIMQLPIFFALYQVLMRSIALKGAHFMWIRDLSEPDRLVILGKEVNILPIVMAIIMFVQQKMTLSSTGSSEAQEQQKFMMIAFPIIFGFLFYRMPSGLVLYWLINSALMLVSQLKATRTK